MAPFGPGNMRPVLISKGVVDSGYAKRVGPAESHLKCSFVVCTQSIDSIGFGLGDYLETVKSSICDIAYVVDEHEWNGKTSLQLNLKGIK